jgi:hypothetical protein
MRESERVVFPNWISIVPNFAYHDLHALKCRCFGYLLCWIEEMPTDQAKQQAFGCFQMTKNCRFRVQNSMSDNKWNIWQLTCEEWRQIQEMFGGCGLLSAPAEHRILNTLDLCKCDNHGWTGN